MGGALENFNQLVASIDSYLETDYYTTLFEVNLNQGLYTVEDMVGSILGRRYYILKNECKNQVLDEVVVYCLQSGILLVILQRGVNYEK